MEPPRLRVQLPPDAPNPGDVRDALSVRGGFFSVDGHIFSDVSEGVLEAIPEAQLQGSLMSLDIRLRWKDEHTLTKPRCAVKRLRELRFPVIVRTFVGEHWSLIEVPEDI